MKSFSRKKIFTLCAVLTLLVAGAAWAAVTSGVISLSPVTANGTDLNNNSWTHDSTDTANPAMAFTATGTSPIVVEDNVTLPTPFGMGSSTANVAAQRSAVVSRAGNPGANASLRFDTTVGGVVNGPLLLLFPPTVDGNASRVNFIYNRMFYAAPTNQYNIDSVRAGNGTNGRSVLDAAAMITLADDQILTIKPGINGNTARRLLGRGAAVGGIADAGARAGIGPDDAGFLRIDGGTTNLYAGNNNVPQTGTQMNEYSGGTFLMKGRLNVAHSNAIGMGPLTLAQDTTLGVIETSNIDIGKNAPDNTSLNNAANPLTGVYPTGKYHQDITVARYDELADYTLVRPRVANVRGTNTKDVTFDVPQIAGVPTTLKVYTGIVQPFENWALEVPNRDYFSVRVVKTGSDTMIVEAGGMRHTGGTYVKEGTLFVDGGNTNQFVGELGSTWWLTPTVATNITAGLSPLETNSAKVNYNLYLAALANDVNHGGVAGGPVWGTDGAPVGAFSTGSRGYQTGNNGAVLNNNLVAPAYMNSFSAPAVGDLARVAGGGYVNPLTIDASAKAKVNRDQFIGDLNGAGTFEIVSWAKGSTEIIPQITMQINNTLSTNSGANANFSGNIVGKANLVLDNPVQATGSGVNADQFTRRVNFFPRTQALTGTNDITAGDTFVKDGSLSVNRAENIAPGTLRIGMYNAGYENAANGVAAGSVNFRGFGNTQNIATFHGLEDMTIAQKTLVYATGIYAGGALGNVALGTPNPPAGLGDAALPNANTRSVTWYGNNPENIASATVTNGEIVGISGRYNAVGPYVNLAATRGKTVSFNDISLFGQNGAVPTIAQVSTTNDIRYIMRNAMAVNDKLDENPNWDGTVHLAASWDMTGATSARMFGFDIKNGTLLLSEVQQAGYALVGIRQGARLSLGNNARAFGETMQVVIEDDSRICVKPQTTDLAATLAEAQTKDAVFMADSINYTGLGEGNNNMDKRLVVQIDLSNIGNTVTDQWIKVVGSHSGPNWNNIHFYSSTAGQTEHLYKVKVAQPNNMVFDGNYSVTPYCDENQYNIYVHIKKLDQPIPTSDDMFNLQATGGASRIDANVTYVDASGDVVPDETITFSIQRGTETPITKTQVTDASGKAAVEFTGLAAGDYNVAATDEAGNASQSKTAYVTGGGGSSSSSSCDAGFGAMALLALAGGALVLRKKD